MATTGRYVYVSTDNYYDGYSVFRYVDNGYGLLNQGRQYAIAPVAQPDRIYCDCNDNVWILYGQVIEKYDVDLVLDTTWGVGGSVDVGNLMGLTITDFKGIDCNASGEIALAFSKSGGAAGITCCVLNSDGTLKWSAAPHASASVGERVKFLSDGSVIHSNNWGLFKLSAAAGATQVTYEGTYTTYGFAVDAAEENIIFHRYQYIRSKTIDGVTQNWSTSVSTGYYDSHIVLFSDGNFAFSTTGHTSLHYRNGSTGAVISYFGNGTAPFQIIKAPEADSVYCVSSVGNDQDVVNGNVRVVNLKTDSLLRYERVQYSPACSVLSVSSCSNTFELDGDEHTVLVASGSTALPVYRGKYNENYGIYLVDSFSVPNQTSISTRWIEIDNDGNIYVLTKISSVDSVIKYDSDLNIDTTWGVGGIWQPAVAFTSASCALLRGDGTLLVGGYTSGTYKAVVYIVDANGATSEVRDLSATQTSDSLVQLFDDDEYVVVVTYNYMFRYDGITLNYVDQAPSLPANPQVFTGGKQRATVWWDKSWSKAGHTGGQYIYRKNNDNYTYFINRDDFSYNGRSPLLYERYSQGVMGDGNTTFSHGAYSTTQGIMAVWNVETRAYTYVVDYKYCPRISGDTFHSCSRLPDDKYLLGCNDYCNFGKYLVTDLTGTVHHFGTLYHNSSAVNIVKGSTSYFGQPPSILDESTGATANSGDTVTLWVTANGIPSPTYQWYKDGAPISGATSATYMFVADADSGGTYFCRATNDLGSVDSTNQAVSIYPAVTISGNRGALCSGEITLTATVTGTSPFTYQWYNVATGLIAGATGAVLNTIADDCVGVMQFYCSVTNAAGTRNSDNYSVTVVAQAYNKNMFDVPMDLDGGL